MRRLPALLTGLYLAGGIAVWISFISTNPDGLANVGLVFYVAPMSLLGVIVGWLTGSKEFPLIPRGLGYQLSHAVFFFPSLIIIAAALYGVMKRRQRLRKGSAEPPLLP